LAGIVKMASNQNLCGRIVKVHVVSFPEAATPPQLRRQVLDLQHETWPPGPGLAPPDNSLTHDPALHPQSLLLIDDGIVLAALDILTSHLSHAGRSYKAGGLSTVVTRRAQRGRGYGHHLVTVGHDVMATSTLDLGLFTCDRPLQSFYEAAGWHTLPGTVLIGGTPTAPFPSDQPGFDKVTLGDFFTDAGRAHRASFENARIELYPGDIDRLW